MQTKRVGVREGRGDYFGLFGSEIGATASKIGHNMETIQVYQDKIKREQKWVWQRRNTPTRQAIEGEIESHGW